MKIVFETIQMVEAHLVCGLLKDRGLFAQVFNADTAGLIGAGQAAVPTTVRVAAEDVDQARAILHAVTPAGEEGGLSLFDVLSKKADGALADPEACPSCGETWEPGFDVCWSCEHEFDRAAPAGETIPAPTTI